MVDARNRPDDRAWSEGRSREPVVIRVEVGGGRVKMTFLTKNQFNFIQNDLVSLTISDFLSSNDPKSVILKFF